VRLSHAPHTISSRFDEDNLMSAVGLVPVMALSDRAGLSDLVDEHVSLAKPGGANAAVKVSALVAGMVAGADSIDDMGLLRHGGMHRIFGGIRAPSTCGTFPRTFTSEHVLQLQAVARRLLANLAGHAPLLPGADQISFLDIDDTMKATYGYAKQGAGYGYNGVKGIECPARHHHHPGRCPAHLRGPAPQRQHQLGPGCGPVRGQLCAHREGRRGRRRRWPHRGPR